MSVNINREVQDPFYRYKMPRLQSKIEGKGNGIKTVVTNMEDVARALARPPSYSTKYFGCELGAQTIMDEKTSRYIVNGAHETQRLVELLDGFIKRFVLCASCCNPETIMFVDKKGFVNLDCKACGHQGRVDNHHKLITFILKTQPPGGPSTSASGGAKKKSKEERRKEKQARNSGNSTSRRGSDDDEEEDGDDVNGATAENGASGAHLNAANQTPADTAADHDGDEEDSGLQFTPALEIAEHNNESSLTSPVPVDDAADEEFSDDVLAAAETMRQNNLAAMNDSIRRLIVNDADKVEKTDKTDKTHSEKTPSAAEAAGQFAEEAGKAANGAELREFANKVKLREDRAAAVATQVWFADALVSELPKRLALMQQFIKGSAMQLGLLGGLERMLSQKPEWQKEMPRVLKYLYDRDVLEEEVILQWAELTSSDYVKPDVAKAIRIASASFLEWLCNAEEESE